MAIFRGAWFGLECLSGVLAHGYWQARSLPSNRHRCCKPIVPCHVNNGIKYGVISLPAL